MHDRAVTAAGTDPALDAVYQALTASVADAVELVVAALVRSGTGTQAMADTYERTDEAVGMWFA